MFYFHLFFLSEDITPASEDKVLKVVFVSRPGKSTSKIRMIANGTISLMVEAFNAVTNGAASFDVCCDFHKEKPCTIAQVSCFCTDYF